MIQQSLLYPESFRKLQHTNVELELAFIENLSERFQTQVYLCTNIGSGRRQTQSKLCYLRLSPLNFQYSLLRERDHLTTMEYGRDGDVAPCGHHHVNNIRSIRGYMDTASFVLVSLANKRLLFFKTSLSD